MKIVITGGSGRVGKYVIEDLKKNGYEITVFDFKKPFINDVRFIKGNMMNIGDCRKAVKGSDVIVHLAAIPSVDINNPPEKVFNVNVGGTFNIFQAAVDMKIKKIVQTSSQCAFGSYLSLSKKIKPLYLPMDENHPQNPSDAYSLSKKISEEIGEFFTKNYNIKTIMLRIGIVYNAWAGSKASFEEELDIGTGLFWWYNFGEDVAQAVRLSIEGKNLEKYEVFNISASDNGTRLNSIELIKKKCGNNVTFIKKITGRESLCDYTKAIKLLGYCPQFSWKDSIK